MLEQKARKRAENSGGTAEQNQYIAADTILHALEDEKSKAARRRRAEIDEFNAGLASKKKDFDGLERKAYKSYDHVETFTSTANMC